jgi:hypothetical protein
VWPDGASFAPPIGGVGTMQSASPMARHLNTPSPADTLDHSFATTANMLGCSEPTIAALLGHSRGSVTGRYVHVVDETLLAAADRVSGAIDQAMAGEKPAKVHKFEDVRRAPPSAS